MNLNKKVVAAITLGIVCFVLTIAIFVQIKTTNNSNSTVAQTMEENDLRDQVLRMKEKYDNIYAELQNATKKLEQVRENATKDDSEAKAKQEELRLNNMLLCQSDMTGEGVIITLKDGTTNNSDILSSLTATDVIVHNSDLLQIVNDLKNAGAEARAQAQPQRLPARGNRPHIKYLSERLSLRGHKYILRRHRCTSSRNTGRNKYIRPSPEA